MKDVQNFLITVHVPVTIGTVKGGSDTDRISEIISYDANKDTLYMDELSDIIIKMRNKVIQADWRYNLKAISTVDNAKLKLSTEFGWDGIVSGHNFITEGTDPRGEYFVKFILAKAIKNVARNYYNHLQDSSDSVVSVIQERMMGNIEKTVQIGEAMLGIPALSDTDLKKRVPKELQSKIKRKYMNKDRLDYRKGVVIRIPYSGFLVKPTHSTIGVKKEHSIECIFPGGDLYRFEYNTHVFNTVASPDPDNLFTRRILKTLVSNKGNYHPEDNHIKLEIREVDNTMPGNHDKKFIYLVDGVEYQDSYLYEDFKGFDAIYTSEIEFLVVNVLRDILKINKDMGTRLVKVNK